MPFREGPGEALSAAALGSMVFVRLPGVALKGPLWGSNQRRRFDSPQKTHLSVHGGERRVSRGNDRITAALDNNLRET